MTHPDILCIVVDDCGYADLSCCGATDYRTPALDRIAAEGVRFTQAYANSALCTNTRVALITGQYQYRFRIGLTEPLRHADRLDPTMGLPADHPTLPLLLRRDGGYRTALIGKWHLGYLPWFGPLKSGYDTFFGVMGGYTGYFTHLGAGGDHDLYEGETTVECQGYVTDLLSDRAAAFVTAAADDPAPFFLSLHYTAPHWPWSAPSVEAAARAREADPADASEGGSPRIYAEMMTILDAGIGRVMEAVRANAAAGRDTLVLFTSDNGGERYSKIWPFVGRKRDLLEGGLRVPQLAWWPGRIPPGVTDAVTISMDLTATCLAAAGVAPSPDHPPDGMDLLPHLAGGTPDADRTLFWRMWERDQRAVRQGPWKYLKVGDREFLYDLDYDPRERTDFARKEPGRLDALRRLHADWNAGMLPPLADQAPPQASFREMLW